MTREEKVSILTNAMAKEMMEEYSQSEREQILGPIAKSADVVVFQYAKMYYADDLKNKSHDELNKYWFWLCDSLGCINGIENKECLSPWPRPLKT
jgi:hypothetical protein